MGESQTICFKIIPQNYLKINRKREKRECVICAEAATGIEQDALKTQASI
jgi:hypothetical protein